MTASDGKPCVRCGTSDWSSNRDCKKCHRDRSSRWSKNNSDRALAYGRRWYHANPEKMIAKRRRWERENREKSNAKTHRYRASKTNAGGSYTAEEFKSLCVHYGNKCLRCGRDNVNLTADHVKPVSKGGTSNIDNIQPLCKSCNSGKRDKHIDYRPDAGPPRWLQCKLFG